MTDSFVLHNVRAASSITKIPLFNDKNKIILRNNETSRKIIIKSKKENEKSK